MNVFDDSYQFWYLREASVGVYISNIPYIWGFLRQTLTFLRASSESTANSQAGYGRRPSRAYALNPQDYGCSASMIRSGLGKETLGTSESEENIISASAAPKEMNLVLSHKIYYTPLLSIVSRVSDLRTWQTSLLR